MITGCCACFLLLVVSAVSAVLAGSGVSVVSAVFRGRKIIKALD